MDNRGVTSSTTILTCFLLFLFSFASARYPFVSTGIDNIDPTNHDSFSVSGKNVLVDVDANILLPSEKLIQWKTETTDSKNSDQRKAETIESMEVPKESSSEATKIDPFTVFTFRSNFDPRIPRRHLPLSFRLGHRCHHNHYYKPWKSHLRRREDIMLKNVEDNKDYNRVARGGVRQILGGWKRFHHVEPMFLSRERSLAMERSELLRRLYNRRRHYRRRHEPENTDTGLMKRIRKFLRNI